MSVTNPFDIGIIIIFGFCLIRGFFRGFVKEVISLIGVLAGFYSACVYYLDIAHLLSKWISHPPYLNILSFLIIFIGVFILVSLLGAVIKYLMDIAFLGWIDRLLGVATGSIKGILIVSILLVSFVTFLPEWKPLIKQSYLAPKVTRLADKMTQMIPKGLKRELTNKIKDLKGTWRINP